MMFEADILKAVEQHMLMERDHLIIETMRKGLIYHISKHDNVWRVDNRETFFTDTDLMKAIERATA